MEPGETSYKKTNIAEDIWKQTSSQHSTTCPQCNKGFLCVVQFEPIYGTDSEYTPYRTIIECSNCSYRKETESFTVLGGIKDFNNEYVEIGSWGPSGSRILSRFKHSISSNLLNELRQSQELVEFLVVNKHVIQVIG